MIKIFHDCHDCPRRRYGFCLTNLLTEDCYDAGRECPYECGCSDCPPYFSKQAPWPHSRGKEWMI